MIVDPDGKGLNDHWVKTGAALLTGNHSPSALRRT